MVMKTSKLSLGGCRGSEASWDFPSYVKRWTWSAGEAAALYPQNLQRAPDLQLRWDQSLLQNATRQDPSCKKWWEDSGLQRQEHGATLLQQDMLTQVIFSGHWKIGQKDQVIFLPKNKTSKLQPLDQDIIATLKRNLIVSMMDSSTSVSD